MTQKISKVEKDKYPGITLLEWARSFRENSIKETEKRRQK